MRRLALIACAVLALGALAGCSSLEKLEKSTNNNKALNRKIGKIPLGTSVESVRAELGKPDSYQVSKSAGLGKTEYLYYGQWQMAFTNGMLESKNKY